MSSKPTLRRNFKAQRHLGKAATRSIQDAVAALIGQSHCGNSHVGRHVADGAEDVGDHLDGQQDGQDLHRRAQGQADGGHAGEEGNLPRQAHRADADRQGDGDGRGDLASQFAARDAEN